jgi:hypothetical protein
VTIWILSKWPDYSPSNTVPERLQPLSQLIAIVRHGFHPHKSINDGDPEIERDREKLKNHSQGSRGRSGKAFVQIAAKYPLGLPTLLAFGATRLDEDLRVNPRPYS